MTRGQPEGVRERLAKATPGPWYVRPREFDDWGRIRAANGWPVAMAGAGGDFDADAHRAAGTDPTQHNADLIANAPTDLAFLLEENARLQSERDQRFTREEVLDLCASVAFLFHRNEEDAGGTDDTAESIAESIVPTKHPRLPDGAQ